MEEYYQQEIYDPMERAIDDALEQQQLLEQLLEQQQLLEQAEMTMSTTNYDNQPQQQQQHYDDDFPRWYRELFVSCFPSSDKEKEEGLIFPPHRYYDDTMMDFLQPVSGDNNNNNNNNKKEWQDFPWQWLLLQQEISQRLTQTQSTTTMP